MFTIQSIRKGAWIFAIAITILVVAFPLYDMVFLGGTGNHKPALLYATGTRTIKVCPSVAWTKADSHYARFDQALRDFRGATGCRVPDLTLGSCETPPAPGEVQLRRCSDLLSTGEFASVGCPEGYVDTVQHSARANGAGVAYWSQHDLPYTPHHIIGHIIGFGHTTAASSWMHPKAGTEPNYIVCD